MDAQAQLRHDLVAAHADADQPGHNDHPHEQLLPSGHDRQQQAAQAEREERCQCAEEIGESGRDIDRHQQRPTGDEEIAGKERDDRFTQHGEVKQAADLRQTDDDDRHDEKGRHGEQPRDQADVDGGVVDETIEGHEHEAKERQKDRLAEERCRR